MGGCYDRFTVRCLMAGALCQHCTGFGGLGRMIIKPENFCCYTEDLCEWIPPEVCRQRECATCPYYGKSGYATITIIMKEEDENERENIQ